MALPTDGPPLSLTLARVAARDEVFRARVGRPTTGRWLSPQDLADAKAPHIESLLSQATEYLGAERRVAAALFFHMYVWAVSAAAICAYVTERRIPEIAEANIAVEFDEHGLGRGVALITPRFAALAGDPAQDDPNVLLLREADLSRRLHMLLVARNLSQVAGAIRERRLLGWPILWGLAADTCAEAFARSGRMQADVQGALHAGEAFLAQRESPLGGRTTLFLHEHAGSRQILYRRAACCLGYKTAVYGYCDTCPLLSDDEQERRLAASPEQN